MLPLLLAPTLAATLFAPAPAVDSFDSALVPSDATWIAHVDVAGIRGSRIFELLQEHGLDLEDPEWAEIEHELGIDPLFDIDGITLFGSPHDIETPTALVSTNPKADHALERLSKHVERSSVEMGGMALDRWEGDGDGPAYSYLARKGEARILIVSPSKTAVVQAVGVLKGDADSLSDDGPDTAGASDGAFLFVTAGAALAEQIPDLDELEPVAKLVRSVRAELGEHGDNAFVKVTLGTAEARHASQIAAMIEGGRAMISLAAEMEPEVEQLLPLLDGVHVDVFGSTVTIAMEQPIDMLVELIENEGHWEGEHDWDDDHDDYRAPPRQADDEGSGWR